MPNLGTYNLCESVSVSGTLAYYSFVLYVICKYPNDWLCTPQHKHMYVNLRALFGYVSMSLSIHTSDYGYTCCPFLYILITHMGSVASFLLITCYGKCNPYQVLSLPVVQLPSYPLLVSPFSVDHTYIFSPQVFDFYAWGWN